jgi:imidazolonepropionase-like amidohydrolase
MTRFFALRKGARRRSGQLLLAAVLLAGPAAENAARAQPENRAPEQTRRERPRRRVETPRRVPAGSPAEIQPQTATPTSRPGQPPAPAQSAPPATPPSATPPPPAPADRPAAQAPTSPPPSLPPAPSGPRWIAPLPQIQPADKPIAIVNANLITLGRAGTIAGGTVLMKGGKIVAVGKEVRVPAGSTLIDGKGKWVMPGIIDCHSHTAIEGGVNEGSDIVTAEVRVADVIDHNDVNIYRQLAGGVTAANLLHGSANVIGGQNAVIKMRWGKPPGELVFKEAPRGIKFALGENPKRSGATGGGRYPGTRMGVEATLRASFAEARTYRQEWQAYQRKLAAVGGSSKDRPAPPRRDLRLETLWDIMDGKIFVHAHAYRADEILMLMRVAEDFGFRVRTFQHVLEGYKVASEMARHGAGGSTFSDWWAYKMEALDAIPYNAAIMAAKGVTVSLNSDSAELARRLYWEAAKATRYGGVSEGDALKMITLNPARQLGVDRWVGSIEPGKHADLAVFTAHPFSPDARVEHTLVDGTVYFDRMKDLAARKPPEPSRESKPVSGLPAPGGPAGGGL